MQVETDVHIRAHKVLKRGDFTEVQTMATLEAIAEMQRPLNERLDNLNDRLDSMQSDMKAGFEKIDSRFLHLTLTLAGLILTSNIAMFWIVLNITRAVGATD